MHPIEHLRFVARADGVAGSVLVRQTAAALASFTDDPTAMVTACRRVVVRQPRSAELAWFCSRVLTALDPAGELWDAVGALESDRTAGHLSELLGPEAEVAVVVPALEIEAALERRPDVVAFGLGSDTPGGALVPTLTQASLLVVEVAAAGGGEVLVPSGALAALLVARHLEVPVWLVVPEGRALAAAVWPAFARRALEGEGECPLESLPVTLADRVVRPSGELAPEALATVADAPAAPELFGAGPGHL